ncbi:hypothetical protein EJ04DRAFT_608674 [Polyplosphaeria fusca]|uniref:Uncharacterized protein n=1 Tax=Polyplosphaeria fusca TaxID=682080 RepID=A0A9P4V1F8_9PLEO|nr:hypothetical protein EJ04DRAFT_608674 [Polyplosphaeria fusca]
MENELIVRIPAANKDYWVYELKCGDINWLTFDPPITGAQRLWNADTLRGMEERLHESDMKSGNRRFYFLNSRQRQTSESLAWYREDWQRRMVYSADADSTEVQRLLPAWETVSKDVAKDLSPSLHFLQVNFIPVSAQFKTQSQAKSIKKIYFFGMGTLSRADAADRRAFAQHFLSLRITRTVRKENPKCDVVYIDFNYDSEDRALILDTIGKKRAEDKGGCIVPAQDEVVPHIRNAISDEDKMWVTLSSDLPYRQLLAHLSMKMEDYRPPTTMICNRSDDPQEYSGNHTDEHVVKFLGGFDHVVDLMNHKNSGTQWESYFNFGHHVDLYASKAGGPGHGASSSS